MDYIPHKSMNFYEIAAMESIKMLLIDDEESTYHIVKHYCKFNTEYTIDIQWYDDIPYDASIINDDNFDLLLLDYRIHQHSGIQLLKQLNLNSDHEWASLSIPVIMLSNTEDIQIASQAIHYGVAEFILKGNLSSKLLNKTINNVFYKHHLKKQLEETNKKLDHTIKKLKNQNEEISNFYQLISHELRTPLTSTIEFINILLDGIEGNLTKAQEDYLMICKRNCRQINLYIGDLLEIGRISTGRYKLHKTFVSINRVVSDAVSASNVIANKKKIKLTFHGLEHDVKFEVDEKRIFQALLILINNAIKFSPQNKDIIIKIEDNIPTKQIHISVIDQGCGIAQEHLDKIFDRLFQENVLDLGPSAGLGLGLYICKEIVRLHNGEISVDSELGKGSKFTLKFYYKDEI